MRRSYQLEHLDTGAYTADEYDGCLIELGRINRLLGDVRALRVRVLKQIADDEVENFSLLDVGAGSGELLRAAGRWSRRKKKCANLVGLELNARACRAMRELNVKENHLAKFDDLTRVARIEEARYEAISNKAIPRVGGDGLIKLSAVQGDAFRLPFKDQSFDYAMCSLFAHHFREHEIIELLKEFKRVARRRVFVLDLHRHRAAYLLYTTLGKIVLHNRLVREDGAVSIKRGFVADELTALAHASGFESYTVRRVFPFRLVLSCKV